MGTLWSAKKTALAVAGVLLAASADSPAALVAIDSPDMDVYMYSNAFNRGGRGDMGSFGGPVGAEGAGSDDRLGQSIIGWDTAGSGIPTGLGAASYAISRVTLRLSRYDVDGAVIRYDPTYDSYRTLLPATDPDYLPDTDQDRPIELHGLGLRNGYTSLAVSGGISGTNYGEGSPFGASGGAEHARHAYAWSHGSPRADGDVSENVTERFESAPFAIGTVAGLVAGDILPSEVDFTFELNLADPGVLSYLRDALNRGELGFAISSMHATDFTGSGGTGGFPRVATRENPLPFLIPNLEIEYTVVPEPAAAQFFIIGAALVASLRAVRRRNHFQ